MLFAFTHQKEPNTTEPQMVETVEITHQDKKTGLSETQQELVSTRELAFMYACQGLIQRGAPWDPPPNKYYTNVIIYLLP
jgi:hypothetical protein